MVSGVSILNFSALRKRFRSSIGLHLLLGFGTKNSLLKNPSELCLCTSYIAFLFIS